MNNTFRNLMALGPVTPAPRPAFPPHWPHVPLQIAQHQPPQVVALAFLGMLALLGVLMGLSM